MSPLAGTFLTPLSSPRPFSEWGCVCIDIMDADFSTPINSVQRETLTILITNNILDNSVEFESDGETMQTDSPLGKPVMQLVSKKLFHSPMGKHPPEVTSYTRVPSQQKQKTMKRKLSLIPDSVEKIKKVFVTEYEKDSKSSKKGGLRQRVFISLFHNKAYSMDVDS